MKRTIKTGIFFFAGSFIIFSCFAQTNDIIRFENLEFNSGFEEKTFISLKEGKENLFRLFAAIDPDVNDKIFPEFEKELSTVFHEIENKKFEKAKPEKKVEMIYDYVNSNVLKSYQEKILFPHLFVNGTFNCLTASAFYGFVMDSLRISYDFRETTSHVHPVAYPQNLQIKIETTNRISGIQYYDDKLKAKFVNYLAEAGLISNEDYYRYSVEELFNQYFFPESSIGMKELAGLHYMNDALYKFHIGMKKEAFIQIKKGYYLYPSERMLAILQFVLAECIRETQFDKPEDAWYFILLSRFPEDRIEPGTIEDLFLYLTNLVLYERGKRNLYDDYYYFLMDNLDEGGIKTRIDFQYNFIRGKSLVNDFKFREGLELLENAFKIRPENIEVQSLLISTFAFIFQNAPRKDLVEELEEYGRTYPSFNKNGVYITLKMNAYLKLAQENLDLEKIQDGLENLGKFEVLFDEYPGVEFNQSLVASAYSSAAVYFFKKYDTEKARKYLEKGLLFAPDNFELRYRLKNL